MMELARLLDVLEQQLPDHLTRQRWSDAASRGVESVTLRWHEVLRTGDPLLVWGVFGVRFTDRGEQDVQLFIGVRQPEHLPEFLHGKERAAMAIAADPDGGAILYDALIDPELAVDVLHLVAPDIEVTMPRPLVLEHANSSIVFDESLILKVFRRVGPGANADAEIPRRLAEAGFEHVLAPIAELRRDDTDLAVLRPFLVGATSAWDLARISLRDVLADRVDPEEAGGDFAGDAARIGGVVASLHVALAAAFGVARGDPEQWAAPLLERLERITRRGELRDGDFPRDAVAARYAELAGLRDAGAGIRIHGNLHLDQLLASDVGWRVLDFEGAATHRVPDGTGGTGGCSPLQDVAGVLRSLHEVAALGLAEWDDADGDLPDLAERWERRNRRAFLDGYLADDAVRALLPGDDPGWRAVLSTFELDRTIDRRGRRAGSSAVDRSAVEHLLGSRAGA